MNGAEIKTSELVNVDVTIIINDEDGRVINGTMGVVGSNTSRLGIGTLGKMTLGR